MSRGKVRQIEWEYEGKAKKTWGYTVVLDGKRLRRAGFGSRAEATEALDLLLHPAPAVESAVVEVLTLKAAFARYEAMKARKKSLAEDQRNAKHLIEAFGDIPLDTLTASKIAGYRAGRLAITKSRRGGTLSAASINRPLQLLRHLLRVAHEEWELITSVPKIRLEKEPQGRIRWLEPDEEHRLLEACAKSANTSLLPIITVALETGMRKSEVLGLTWDRVDLTRGVIRLEVTKSGKRREIPMRQAVYDTLAGLPGAREGRVWPVGDPRNAFERAVEEAKLDAPFTFHCCRHHFASWFVMRGGNIVALQDLLGHASLTMTRRYSHLAPEHLRAEIAKTEKASGRTRAEEVLDSEASLVSS
jgi:integrase